MASFSSVKRGTVTLSSTLTTVTVSISSVNTGASVLWFNTRTGSAGVGDPRMELIDGQLISDTEINFRRGVGLGAATQTIINWQVTEFATGVSVQRGTFDLIGSADVELTVSPVDATKTFPLVSAQTLATLYGVDVGPTVHLTSSTSLVFQLLGASITSGVSWQLVEYDNCVVQTGIADWNGTTRTQSFALTTASADKTILLMSTRLGGTSGPHQGTVRVTLSATGMAWARDSTGQPVAHRWHVVTFSDAAAQQKLTALTTGSLSVTVAVSPTLTVGNAIVISPWQQNWTSGLCVASTSAAFTRGAWTGAFPSVTNATQILLRRVDGSASNATPHFFTLAWPDAGALTYSDTHTATIVLTDAVTQSYTASTTLSEALTPADAVTVSASLTPTFSAAVTPDVTLSVSVSLATVERTEAVTVAAAESATVTLSISLGEAVTVTDAVTGGFAYTSTVSDTVELADAYAGELDDIRGRRRRTRGYRRTWATVFATDTAKDAEAVLPSHPRAGLAERVVSPIPVPVARIDMVRLNQALTRLEDQDDEDAILLLFF